jgi:hypothetical protein
MGKLGLLRHRCHVVTKPLVLAFWLIRNRYAVEYQQRQILRNGVHPQCQRWGAQKLFLRVQSFFLLLDDRG